MDVKRHPTRRPRSASTLRGAVVAATLAGAASNASAFFDDRLQVFVGETLTHESNVFRISQGVDPQTVIGSSERGDTYRTTTVGASLDLPVSQQRIQAGVDWSQVRYNRFTGIDHTDRNARLNWIWQAGDRLNGQLGYTDTYTLAPFTNFFGPVANRLTTQMVSATANWRPAAHWEVQGIGSEMRQRNELDVRKPNDINLDSLQLGVNFVSTAGNRIGVDVRQEDGRYPNLEPVGGFLVKNDYVQKSVGALTDWTLTGKSHVAARIDHVRRDYDEFSGRNFTGTTARAAYDWLITDKTTLNVVAQRDISSSEDVQTSFVLVKGIAISPSYAFSEKIRVSAMLSANVRDYLGNSGSVAGLPGVFSGRVDHVHAGMVSVTYQPLRSLTLALSAQRETRTSNLPLLDYAANIVTLSARLTF